jgi:hypothetical protein
MKLAAFAFLAGALWSWWLTAEYKDNKWVATLAESNQQAADQLQKATERVLQAEREQRLAARKLEVTHVENQQLLDQVLDDNRKLARQLDGLYDPGDKSYSGDTLSSTGGTGQSSNQAAPGRLSAKTSDFLLEYAREADRVAEYADTCYKWATQMQQNH